MPAPPVPSPQLPLFSPSRYYITRAKLVSKIAKYPHVVSLGFGVEGALRASCLPSSWGRALCLSRQEDYRRTVTEIDEKEYISLRLIISELRNQYVSGPRPIHSAGFPESPRLEELCTWGPSAWRPRWAATPQLQTCAQCFLLTHLVPSTSRILGPGWCLLPGPGLRVQWGDCPHCALHGRLLQKVGQPW